ncbi:MAG: outer membrane beta-barrel protein [bacterium]
MKKSLLLLTAIMTVFSLCNQKVRAQSEEKRLEVGGQFSFIQVPVRTVDSTGFGLSSSQETVPGFGGRIGFNFSRHVGIEAEGNFFPRDRDREGGRKIQGLFGVKAGKRFNQGGLFAKARPGFVHFSRGDYQPGTGGCAAVFPPPIGCFQPVAKTSFAFDLGGVGELYPSKNTIVRFDAGDTIVRFGARRVAARSTSLNGLVVVPVAAETKHNLQASFGFGYRF